MPTSRWWLYWAAPSGLRLQILTQALRENLVSDHVGELKVWAPATFACLSWRKYPRTTRLSDICDHKLVQQQSPEAHHQQNHQRASGGRLLQHPITGRVLTRLKDPAVVLHCRSVVHSVENVTPAVSWLLHTHSCELSVSQLCDVASRLASGETSTHTHTQILHRKHTDAEGETNALTNNPNAISESHTPVSWLAEQDARGVQLPAARCWHGQRRNTARQCSAHSPH